MTARLSQSAPVRKAIAAFKQLPRRLVTLCSSPESFAQRPPVFVNSFPKSGTHLLKQVLEAVPGKKDYGSFWASLTSSMQFRERSPANTTGLLLRVAPAELVTGHLYYQPAYRDCLERRRVMHFFIYRDLRDVVVSEAHYLGEMNRWHKLHPYFKGKSLEERITLSICGLSESNLPYPDIAARFASFEGWLGCPDVCCVRFEELSQAATRRATVERILDYCRRRDRSLADDDQLLARALANIEPKRSHTFRSGKAGGWRESFTPEHCRLMKERAGDLLVRLGYETGPDW